MNFLNFSYASKADPAPMGIFSGSPESRFQSSGYQINTPLTLTSEFLNQDRVK
ncbi:hypothetical protein [Desulfamplus magnetovallimortis]|uniref:hypothetical protein n=1 Tax=Desulfamplus magnetovallimortis TaxID=1246637 RepID=UPI0016445D4E|nr:hypothetical protein [Desulfamplus magnetovallimortis]